MSTLCRIARAATKIIPDRAAVRTQERLKKESHIFERKVFCHILVDVYRYSDRRRSKQVGARTGTN